jgi:hypothetical protein
MSSHRYNIDAYAGPGTERLADGSSRLLVRVRMFDDGVEHPQPEVLCDLSPDEARELGFCLLTCAEYAGQLRVHAQFRRHPYRRATPSRRQPPAPEAGQTDQA